MNLKHIFLKFIIAGSACIYTNIAKAEIFDCTINASRNGLSGAEFYINNENHAYLLLRFRDLRYDDTTEVYRVRGCKKISSGVSSKSTFEVKLKEAGYSGHNLFTSQTVNVSNAIYGTATVTLSEQNVSAKLDAYSEDKIQNIISAREVVKLNLNFSESIINKLMPDDSIKVISADEFNNKGLAKISNESLADQYFDYARIELLYKNTNFENIIVHQYKNNISNAIRDRLRANDGLLSVFEEKYNSRITKYSSDKKIQLGLNDYIYLTNAGVQSERMLTTLANVIRLNGKFSDGVDAYQKINNIKLIDSLHTMAQTDDELDKLQNIASLNNGSASTYKDHIETVFDSRLNHVSDNKEKLQIAKKWYVMAAKLDIISDKSLTTLTSHLRTTGDFSDLLEMYHIKKNIKLIDDFQHLAKSDSDFKYLEQIAITLPNVASRVFSVGFLGSHGATTTSYSEYAGSFFALYMNATRNWASRIPIRGQINVYKSTSSPLSLKHGSYKINLEVTLRAMQGRYRKGALGNNDTENANLIQIKRQVSVVVTGNSWKSDASVDFGSIDAATMELGSRNGFDQFYISKPPTVEINIIGVQAL